MEQRRCHSLINVKNSFWRGLALPDWQRQPTNFYIISIVFMLIYTRRSRGNNSEWIINDSFHAPISFRVFEANQLQKQHRCLSSNLLPQARFAAKLKQTVNFYFLSCFVSFHSHTQVKNHVSFETLRAVLLIVGGSCQVFWQQKVRERVASQICGQYIVGVMYRHSKTFLQVSMSITTPHQTTYLPLPY